MIPRYPHSSGLQRAEHLSATERHAWFTPDPALRCWPCRLQSLGINAKAECAKARRLTNTYHRSTSACLSGLHMNRQARDKLLQEGELDRAVQRIARHTEDGSGMACHVSFTAHGKGGWPRLQVLKSGER